MTRILMLTLVLLISGCGTTHFAALSADLEKRLDQCERPQRPPADWLSCGDGEEACRRAKELPLHAENARRHEACADLIDDVKAEAERARAQR